MNFEEIKKRLCTEERHDFASLADIVALLRCENGCPWDRAQNHESIRENLIEETYEVVEAIDKADTKLMREELGDLMLQAVFHAQIEAEKGTFTVDDVINDICEKLIRRHPHIFTDSDKLLRKNGEIIYDWEEIKSAEKGSKKREETLYSIPPSLPALMKADKLQKKYRRIYGVFPTDIEALERDFDELLHACAAADSAGEHVSALSGKFLMELSAFLYGAGIDCEKALSDSISNFISNL